MPTPRSTTIRASEIGAYLYCKRAWYYQRAGHASRNEGEMLTGTELHQQHGRTVLAAGVQRAIGWFLLLAALVLLIVHYLGGAL
jgi:hypothetical protein